MWIPPVILTGFSFEERVGDRVTPKGSNQNGGVGNRQIEHDLRFLIAALHWRTKRPVGGGRRLLDANPLADLEKGVVPREPNPNRPILFHDQFLAMLAVAEEIDWRFELALIRRWCMAWR
jgi:hypothetical protein